jgi:hypothetical protein
MRCGVTRRTGDRDGSMFASRLIMKDGTDTHGSTSSRRRAEGRVERWHLRSWEAANTFNDCRHL